MSELEEIIEDLKCPGCGAYLSFRTIIDYKMVNRKIQCSRCLDTLSINIEVKGIKRDEQIEN